MNYNNRVYRAAPKTCVNPHYPSSHYSYWTHWHWTMAEALECANGRSRRSNLNFRYRVVPSRKYPDRFMIYRIEKNSKRDLRWRNLFILKERQRQFKAWLSWRSAVEGKEITRWNC